MTSMKGNSDQSWRAMQSSDQPLPNKDSAKPPSFQRMRSLPLAGAKKSGRPLVDLKPLKTPNLVESRWTTLRLL